MLLKVLLLVFLATHYLVESADSLSNIASESEHKSVGENLPPAVPFETSHKHPGAVDWEEGFQTSHKISIRATDSADYSMNLLPTKERPELNPVLSALINEDVMKSIEAKRAIEEEELAEVRREIEQAAMLELDQKSGFTTTETPALLLTTLPTAGKKLDNLDEDIVVDPHEDFINQNFALDSAGSENSKKSRIEIKKGPNGQDYEYEYVYYYEEDDEPSKVDASAEPETRGKTRYTNIERSTTATPSGNSLQSGKAKGRSSDASEDIEAERLPMNTRFPSRGKNIEVPPTPALDSLEIAAERKKISVKRPSLELVDSATFNTDEKQTKAARKGENELKPVIAIEQEEAARKKLQDAKEEQARKDKEAEMSVDQEDFEQTTPSMEKAALDLYAILTNENLNNEQTTVIPDTIGSEGFTTFATETASTDEDEAGGLTTLIDEISSSTTTTTVAPTTTTTTTTEPPTTTSTTTTTTAAPSLFGGRRAGLSGLGGRNRFKLNRAEGGSTTTSTTEAPVASETNKTGRNRFSRPSIGGRSRPGARTTSAPDATSVATPAAEEGIVVAKEVKPVSTSFARGRPRNRFSLRVSTTTARPSEESPAEDDTPAESPSTTAKSTLRGRPGLGLRGRSRTTTTKAPTSAEGAEAVESSATAGSEDAKSGLALPSTGESVRPSRFNLHRAGGNRLLPRGKLGRSGVSTEAPKETQTAEDSAAESSSHLNDVKEEQTAGGEPSEKANEAGDATAVAPAAPVSGLNRLRTRPRLNALTHKTDAVKPKASAAPAPAPRKINPLLAKRRLQLGATSTTESPAEEEHLSMDSSAEQSDKEESLAGGSNETGAEGAGKPENETTEATEATTKQQARGLGLLGQRRRLPLRKPGTIL
ncbi:mucin-5AC [Drosophila erecta]|uniref:Uncharacterized protein, isoform A n=1 Tax=Drosophila erecta TaxID=7220 RepID=B3P956_DROER|nr:mucin-5AC [Drosophila erecta]XP_015008774.1 mucin-5AC [Drosophila erecta]XP_026838939.1 mucin-5AC [Drosophila erecta]XP_026838940.1 mucin-5AC [Drosophila erecta]XP_026838941.1 mucin-5AC [Drosophila erecta]EDV45352.1 uncharacterized protein Dere_GG12779, isoform A [Drosophila erecta]KQS25940.1 uncharacterized protein Dere_GG12779, isoform B [Drosophila erecta]